MSRSKGKRYDGEKKLNMKKVAAVIIALLVIIMFVIVIYKLVNNKSQTKEKTFVTAYYTIYENNKWGVIDTKGNVVIEPTYNEMIVIPDDSKPIFVCTTDVNYTDGSFNTKVINDKNNSLYTNYDKVEVIYNHDKDNNLWYEKNVLKVQKDGKYGLINLEGKELLPCNQDDISALVGTENALVTSKEGKKGIVDNSGKVIIENQYKDVASLTDKYENGFIVENDEGKFGVINYDTTTALETKYEGIKNVYGNNMYVVKENNKWKLVNTDGEIFLEDKFEDITSINTQNIIAKVNGKFGVITIEGENKIQSIYDELTFAFSDCYIAKKDNKYGIVNINGEEKLAFNYTYLKYLSEADFIQAELENSDTQLLDRNFNVKVTGIVTQINEDKNYIRVRQNDEYKYYNFKLEEKTNTQILSTNTIFLSKKDGKYGYVDNKGIVVVDYIYDDATEQNKYGFVSVKKDGKWGCLDQKGKIIVEPKYALENNLVVDFIGQWHLSEDINSNYYTK